MPRQGDGPAVKGSPRGAASAPRSSATEPLPRQVCQVMHARRPLRAWEALTRPLAIGSVPTQRNRHLGRRPASRRWRRRRGAIDHRTPSRSKRRRLPRSPPSRPLRRDFQATLFPPRSQLLKSRAALPRSRVVLCGNPDPRHPGRLPFGAKRAAGAPAATRNARRFTRSPGRSAPASRPAPRRPIRACGGSARRPGALRFDGRRPASRPSTPARIGRCLPGLAMSAP